MSDIPALLSKEAINQLIRVEPIFGEILAQFGCPPFWKRPDDFESLCRIILEQQVSLSSAYASYKKLKTVVSRFEPDLVLNTPNEVMREATISRQKARYLKELSKAVLSGTLVLSDLRSMKKRDVFNKLTSVIGIGPWTAEVYQIFCLQEPDIFPKGDVALLRAIRELKNTASSEESYLLAESWSPYRSTASFFLWHHYLSVRGRTASFE